MNKVYLVRGMESLQIAEDIIEGEVTLVEELRERYGEYCDCDIEEFVFETPAEAKAFALGVFESEGDCSHYSVVTEEQYKMINAIVEEL